MPCLLNGIIVLDKPAGITSRSAVNRVKRLLPRKTKIGHAGTLDPFATGVLLLLVGSATKKCEELMGSAKQYEATIRFGATTATDDPESPEAGYVSAHGVKARATGEFPSVGEVRTALDSFIGTIEQRPPIYSALKISGKRACDRVRAGETVELKSRLVRIDAIDLLRFDWPYAAVRIDCGRGTYIRSIARDLGEKLNVGGYLTQLRRTRIGIYSVETAATFESIESAGVETLLQPG